MINQKTTSPNDEEKKKIKYETVTIQLPKRVMDFLRFQAQQQEFSAVERLIEYDLIDNLRAEFEGVNGEQLIAMFDLGPIFWEILGDYRYKPKDEKSKAEVMLDRETIEFAEKHGININEAVKQHLERLKTKIIN